MAQSSEDAPTPAKRPIILTNKASDSPTESKEELVKMFCMGLRPSFILEDSFLEFMKNISNYTLPSKKKFNEELMLEVFNRARSDLMKTLGSVRYVAISIETWKWRETDESNIMLTVTAHFVHQSKFVSHTLFTIAIKEWTKENIGKAIKAGLIEWHVLNKVAILISSGQPRRHAKLLKDVAVYMLEKPHSPCVGDILNKIIMKSLSHLNFIELESKCQNDKSEPVLKTKKDEPFCWHDQYMVLKHISEDNADNFTAVERKAYSECFQILKFVEDLNNKLSSQRYITRSCIGPLFVGLQLKMSKCAPSSTLAKDLKKKLLQEIKKDIMQSPCTALQEPSLSLKATLMDPRFKTSILKHYNKYLRTQFETKLMISLYNNQQNSVPCTSNDQPEENVNVLDYLSNDREKMASARAEAMVSHYVCVPDIPIEANPFQFWEEFSRMHKYSEFYNMAQEYLCIPANAVPIETISGEFPWNKFAPNSRTYNERRKSLEYENIDKVLFLHSYYSNTTSEGMF